jgi:hypothetical protein
VVRSYHTHARIRNGFKDLDRNHERNTLLVRPLWRWMDTIRTF